MHHAHVHVVSSLLCDLMLIIRSIKKRVQSSLLKPIFKHSMTVLFLLQNTVPHTSDLETLVARSDMYLFDYMLSIFCKQFVYLIIYIHV